MRRERNTIYDETTGAYFGESMPISRAEMDAPGLAVPVPRPEPSGVSGLHPARACTHAVFRTRCGRGRRAARRHRGRGCGELLHRLRQGWPEQRGGAPFARIGGDVRRADRAMGGLLGRRRRGERGSRTLRRHRRARWRVARVSQRRGRGIGAADRAGGTRHRRMRLEQGPARTIREGGRRPRAEERFLSTGPLVPEHTGRSENR